MPRPRPRARRRRRPPPSSSSRPGADDPVAALRAGLLAADDIGPGYTRGDDPQPEPSTPTPCGGPSTVAQFPNAVRVGVSHDGPQAASVTETVSVYGDQATSDAAFAAVHDGLACGQGTIGAESVVITPREDLRADVGGDQASGWRVGGDRFDAIYISVQIGPAVVNLVFLAPTNVDTSTLPDPLPIAARGVQKIRAA